MQVLEERRWLETIINLQHNKLQKAKWSEYFLNPPYITFAQAYIQYIQNTLRSSEMNRFVLTNIHTKSEQYTRKRQQDIDTILGSEQQMLLDTYCFCSRYYGSKPEGAGNQAYKEAWFPVPSRAGNRIVFVCIIIIIIIIIVVVAVVLLLILVLLLQLLLLLILLLLLLL